jgi:hypothetical protein
MQCSVEGLGHGSRVARRLPGMGLLSLVLTPTSRGNHRWGRRQRRPYTDATGCYQLHPRLLWPNREGWSLWWLRGGKRYGFLSVCPGGDRCSLLRLAEPQPSKPMWPRSQQSSTFEVSIVAYCHIGLKGWKAGRDYHCKSDPGPGLFHERDRWMILIAFQTASLLRKRLAAENPLVPPAILYSPFRNSRLFSQGKRKQIGCVL